MLPDTIPQPVLETDRFILRPFKLADAQNVQRLAGAWEIADTTLNIPHPYEDGMAEQWIASLQPRYEDGSHFTVAITLKQGGALLGAMSLMSINAAFARAELGYWVGKPYWGQGVATETARELLRYGFEKLHLNRIFAFHITRNPASGRVMQKTGMLYEGRLRQHVRKWGKFEDLEVYGILRSDWQQSQAQA
jgi:[ribosomal protein S5]-alanine N-acetyltransferase